MKIIIPMSGMGKRFVAAGYTQPKPLIEVDGLPIIKHVMDLFPGETDIHCICNKEHIETTDMRSILEGYGATVHVIESHVLGPVYAALQIADRIADDEEVIVSYCDYGTVWDYAAFLKEVRRTQVDGAIAAYRGFHPHMLGTDNYAFLRLAEDGLVAEVREKEPFTTNRMEEYASNGTYYFRRGVDMKHYFQKLIDLGIQKNGEYYVSLVYNLLLQDAKRVSVFEIEKMLQWGTPKDLEEYRVWSKHFCQAAKPSVQCQSSATLILPLAGRGSRFLMNGFTIPKPLLPVNGKPMIVRAVESIPRCKAQTFLCLNEHMAAYPLSDTLKQEFPDSTIIGIDEVTEGQACTCEIGLNGAGIAPTDPIMISACDNGVDYDREAYLRLENDPSVDVIVWSFTNNPTGQLYPHMYAWLDVDADNNIKHVSVKKPLPGAIHAIIGTMFFRSAALYTEGLKEIYEKQIRTNGEFYVDNLLNPLIEKGYRVKVFPVEAYICWGTPNDYKTYQYWLEYFSKKWDLPLIM
jgi:NDP-sugar pyrophosphorylase family protein